MGRSSSQQNYTASKAVTALSCEEQKPPKTKICDTSPARSGTSSWTATSRGENHLATYAHNQDQSFVSSNSFSFDGICLAISSRTFSACLASLPLSTPGL